MKKSLFFILFLSIPFFASSGAQTTYEEVMREHISQLAEASTVVELQQVANGFVRISQNHKDEWLPFYYAALAYANIGYVSEGEVAEKDAFFDEAEKHLDKAMELSKNNAELISLKGYILMGKLNASPTARGQSLSPVVIQTFRRAVQIDEKNPRAMILLARMELGMARFMGQVPTQACEMVGKARTLFKLEYERLSSDSLMPKWGSNVVDQMESVCQ